MGMGGCTAAAILTRASALYHAPACTSIRNHRVVTGCVLECDSLWPGFGPIAHKCTLHSKLD